MDLDMLKSSPPSRAHVAIVLLGVAAGGLGCHGAPAPQGQVLARVDGHDVTAQDVAAEARGSSVAYTPQAQGALLRRVIDRQLLAQSARSQRLDSTPDAPSDLARILLGWRAQLAVSRLLRGLTDPSSQQTQAFISSNGGLFQNRCLYRVETLSVASPPALQKSLQTYEDFDAADTFLRRMGLEVKRSRGALDSAQLAPAFAKALAHIPDGKLIFTPGPGRTLLTRILSRQAKPIVGEAAVALARQRLRQEVTEARIGAELERLRRRAIINYQAGHAPPSPYACGANVGQSTVERVDPAAATFRAQDSC